MTHSDTKNLEVLALAGDLRIAIGRVFRQLRREADAGDYTRSQLAVLHHLEKSGPSTVTTLANAEGMRTQSMGATVAALEAAGLIAGSPDPSDGRRTILALTDAAIERFATSRAARTDWLASSIEKHLTADEQRQLAVALPLLDRLVP